MIRFENTLSIAFLVYVSIYTVSFGIWTWKRKNRLGAVMVFVVALASAALPLYSIFSSGY